MFSHLLPIFAAAFLIISGVISCVGLSGNESYAPHRIYQFRTAPSFDTANESEAPAGGICSSDALSLQLARSSVWEIATRVKVLTGYLPSWSGQIGRMQRTAGRGQTALIESALGRFGSPTLALVYGTDKEALCVWLLAPNGLLASAASTTFDEWAFHRLWSGLDVLARSAQRGPVAKEPKTNCPARTLSETEPDLAPELEALSEAARILLPESIRSALLGSALPNPRLLILPTRDLAKVPFAALPLEGSETLIDRYDLLVLPSVSSLDPEIGSDRAMFHEAIRGEIAYHEFAVRRQHLLRRAAQEHYERSVSIRNQISKPNATVIPPEERAKMIEEGRVAADQASSLQQQLEELQEFLVWHQIYIRELPLVAEKYLGSNAAPANTPIPHSKSKVAQEKLARTEVVPLVRTAFPLR
jgi:hypothetical protein